MITYRAADFVAAARSLVGVRFRHQGRSEHGLDCIGTIIVARLKLGPWEATKFDVVNYRRNPKDSLAVTLPKFLQRIDRPEIGAIAEIKWPKMATANHVAILTPENLIHAYAEVGRVIETGYRAKWPEWTVGLWRIPGLE